jgi:hypothetical protein
MPKKKNLTLKRLTRIMQDLAGPDEKVGEDIGCDGGVRKGSHISEGALFFISIESSFLFELLNFDYAPTVAMFDEYDAKLRDALSEYGVHFEHYNNCILHIYE